MCIKIEEQWNRDAQILKVGLESPENTMNENLNFYSPNISRNIMWYILTFPKAIGFQFLAKGKFINL